MPFFGHFIIAMSIIIPIYYFNKEKFHYKVAVIFVLNNWIGPDTAHAYFFLPINFHYLIPYLFWALPMAFFYSYISRFSIKFENRKFRVIDDKHKVLNWRNAYLLMISGGILHTVSDTIFRSNLKFKFIENIFEPRLYEIQEYGMGFGIDSGAIHLYGYLILIFMSFLIFFFFNRNIKDMLIFYSIYIAVVIVSILLLGDDLAGEEFDIGVIFIAIIFIFIPLFLLFYVANSVSKQDPESMKTRILSEKQIKRGLLSVSIITLLISGLLLTWGVLCFTNSEIFEEFFKVNENGVIFLGIFVLILAFCALYGGIGIFFKQKFARLITALMLSFLLVFIYPMFAVFYLYQDDVKTFYDKKELSSNLQLVTTT
ncbi:MAG: hypothetical protein ACTSRX_10190 [Promethearchaeota archaeon]